MRAHDESMTAAESCMRVSGQTRLSETRLFSTIESENIYEFEYPAYDESGYRSAGVNVVRES